MRLLCDVYRSPRKDEMYLYIDKSRGLQAVPEALLTQFGKPELVMTFLLDGKRTLARVDTARVIESLQQQGFYLQVPPPQESLLEQERAWRSANPDV